MSSKKFKKIFISDFTCSQWAPNGELLQCEPGDICKTLYICPIQDANVPYV